MTSTPPLDWHDKGIWVAHEAVSNEEFLATSPSLFDGTFSWPVMAIRESQLDANIATMAEFCARHRLDFAPHGKTTMAPALFARQIDAGAWGITLAMPHQVRVGFGHGVKRILLANEIIDSAALDAIAELLVADPERKFLCYVDSVEGVRAIADAGARHPKLQGGIQVLIDVGWSGGRTGVRSADEAIGLARLVDETANIQLAGVSCYEGGLKSTEAVIEHFADVRAIAETLISLGLVHNNPVLSAGGSAYFDLVASEFSQWAQTHGVQVILRSGATVSHDDGIYIDKTAFNRIPDEGHLSAALEVWAQVVSVPEQGLAIMGMGKRDAPYDKGMPVPKLLRRAGSRSTEDIREETHVSGLDDQHAYFRFDEKLAVRPGDLVCFGISHPCTAFDKWRVVPVLDDEDQVVDLLRCYF